MAQLNVSTFCIVTGASRGIGKEVAIQLAQKFGPNSRLCLIDKLSLEETTSLVKEKSGENVSVECITVDLSDEDGVPELNQSIFGAIGDMSSFEHAIIVHNASTVGPITRYAREVDDVEYIQKYNMLCLTGPIVMTSEFFKVFGHGEGTVRKTIVQMTSSIGNTPTKTLHIYGMVKAAREMFFRVVALEEPEVRVMSFDPGMVDTSLFEEMATTCGNVEQRFTAQELMKQSYFLKPEQAAGALVKSIEEDKYESGSVVRCFDVMGIDIQTWGKML